MLRSDQFQSFGIGVLPILGRLLQGKTEGCDRIPTSKLRLTLMETFDLLEASGISSRIARISGTAWPVGTQGKSHDSTVNNVKLGTPALLRPVLNN